MAATGINQQIYDNLLAFYRSAASKVGGINRLIQPGYREASRQTGVARETAKRAFYVGWVKDNFRPIKDMLYGEELAAHAAREEAEQERKRKARGDKARELELIREEQRKAAKDIAKMRAALGELAKNAVAGAATLLSMARNLQPGLEQLTKDLSGLLGGKDPKTGQLLPLPQGAVALTNKDRIEILKAASTLIKNMGLMSKYASELEKETMGLPPVPDIKEEMDSMATGELVAQLTEFLEIIKEGEGCYEPEDDDSDGAERLH